MLVDLYNHVDGPCVAAAVNLRQCFGDDDDGFADARDRLDQERSGWIGGGASQPFFAVVVNDGDAAS